MKKILLGFCVIAFSVSAVVADELSVRLVQNCKDRMKLQTNSNKSFQAECLVKIENMVAQQGADATIREFWYVWSPKEPMEKVMTKLFDKITTEKEFKDGQELSNEILQLMDKGDYLTLTCLYAGKPNTKCLKD